MNWFIIATLMGDSYRKSRSSGSSMNWIFLLVGITIVLMAVGWYFWDQKQTKLVTKKKSISLFQELCNLHQLTSSEQALLQQAIHGHALKQGTLAFLDPVILLQHADQNQSESQQWIDLKTKLFGK